MSTTRRTSFLTSGSYSDLQNLLDQLETAQKDNFFVRLLRNSEIESQLDDAKRRLEKATRQFEVNLFV